jgi:hypothetical protein
MFAGHNILVIHSKVQTIREYCQFGAETFSAYHQSKNTGFWICSPHIPDQIRLLADEHAIYAARGCAVPPQVHGH